MPRGVLTQDQLVLAERRIILECRWCGVIGQTVFQQIRSRHERQEVGARQADIDIRARRAGLPGTDGELVETGKRRNPSRR